MIARIWHRYTTPSDADDYEATRRADVPPGIKAVRDDLGSYILRRSSGDEVEFVTVLLWESLDALRAFAGPDYKLAIVPAERRRFLLHYDERAAHYEVLFQPDASPLEEATEGETWHPRTATIHANYPERRCALSCFYSWSAQPHSLRRISRRTKPSSAKTY
jgi:hypothetical protein